jgi:hypothetical protein
MRRLEHLHRRRAFCSFALLLWFTLSNTGATASSPMRQEAGLVTTAGMASGFFAAVLFIHRGSVCSRDSVIRTAIRATIDRTVLA